MLLSHCRVFFATSNAPRFSIPATRAPSSAGVIASSGRLRSFGSIKQQIDALIPGGMPHWTFHDLRRTARSNFSGLCPSDEPKDSKLRFSDTVCELAIAHRPSGIEGVYNKHQYRDELRLLFARWEAHLLGIVGEPVPNVVPLRPRRSGVKA